MNCPVCHGKGRVVGTTTFGQGTKPPIELTEIGICGTCYGLGTLHCCEGEQEHPEPREQAMLKATDADPNG